MTTLGPAGSPPTEATDVRASLIRDFVFETLFPVERDAAAARLCLSNDDDKGAAYHLKRIVVSVKAAAGAINELRDLLSGQPS